MRKQITMNCLIRTSALAVALALYWIPSAYAGPIGVDSGSSANRYDAVGRLRPNSSPAAKLGKAPPYVLVDKAGAPRCYITPNPSQNLDDLVNLRIGVRGSIRALENDSLPHILTREVRPVDAPSSSQNPIRDTFIRTASHVEPNSITEEISSPSAATTLEPQAEEIIPTPDPTVNDGPDGSSFVSPDDGIVYYDEDSITDPAGSRGSCNSRGNGCFGNGNCGLNLLGCNSPCCNPCRMPCCNSCWANDPGPYWVRAEWLLWDTSGMNLPALITTGPPSDAPGALGQQGTQILFGAEEVNSCAVSGGRIRFGRWLGPCQSWGIEGEYFSLENQTTQFIGSSRGSPVLARPFFDVLNGEETSLPIAAPNTSEGTVVATATSGFQGVGVSLRHTLCCKNLCYPGICQPCTVPGGNRVGVLAGYRYLRLDDNVSVIEGVTSLDQQEEDGSFVLSDRFDTTNQFHGAEIGFVWELRRCRWSLELLSKLALGNTRSGIRVNGATTFLDSEDANEETGGLLAQRTNIGNYTRDRFAVVPQIGATLGYNLTCRLKFTVGYSLIYWSQVIRAGDVISLDVNSNLIPPEVEPFTGPLRPQLVNCYTDYWAQGLNLGLDYRF